MYQNGVDVNFIYAKYWSVLLLARVVSLPKLNVIDLKNFATNWFQPAQASEKKVGKKYDEKPQRKTTT